MTIRWGWRKSSRSATNGDCVEIGTSTDTPVIAIRDSKMGENSPILKFSRSGLAAFVADAKALKFDNLT